MPLTLSANREAARPARRRYHAFGLQIASDFELAEVVGGSSQVEDVAFVREDVGGVPTVAEGLRLEFSDDHALMGWPELGSFRISGGDRIAVEPFPGVEDGLLSLPLLGPVMSLLLHQRGLLVLHGSAVEVNGAGAVFLGDKTAGKSTTAAALVTTGHRLVTDDVVAVSFAEGRPVIPAAYPQLKLMRDAAARLTLAGAVDLPRPHVDFDKTRQRLAHGFTDAPTTPKALYILERGAEGEPVAIEPLAGAQAFAAVMRFSYTVRFGHALLSGRTEAAHMAQCARLAAQVPVRRLTASRGLDRLGELTARIAEDLA